MFLRSPENKIPSPTDLIDTVRPYVKDLGLTLVIEPGRSMVASSSALVNTVTGACVCAFGWVVMWMCGCGCGRAGVGMWV